MGVKCPIDNKKLEKLPKVWAGIQCVMHGID